ncbi:MAG: YebC/PmpR family DNA-binding transcriptional regulator [Thermovirgaceae bacterium]
MAGHSKWANIKHRKAAQDAKRGREFQKHVRAIMVAAREGGGDPAMNVRLKAAIDRAKSVNLPSDSIEKAIKKGTGDMEGVRYEEVVYEGYGSGGIAVLVETLTDNKNRTASEIRHLFSKSGGSLGESGCVSWLFERKGILFVQGEGLDEEELLTACLESGAEDLAKEKGGFTVTTNPPVLSDVREKLQALGYSVEKAEVDMTPKNYVKVRSREEAAKILKFMYALEDHDDVQNVYANFDIDDEMIEEIAG